MDEDDVSPLAMSIMGAIEARRFPLRVSEMQVGQLSDYEALAILRVIRKRGLQLDYRPNDGQFTIREGGY